MRNHIAAPVILAVVNLAAAGSLQPALDSVFQLYVTHDYSAAAELLQSIVDRFPTGEASLAARLELADCQLDKLNRYPAAESGYTSILADFQRDKLVPDIMYRLALTQELQERYLDAAQNYEVVATQHMKSRFGADALDAIERCFRKNYQDRVAYVDGYPITRIEIDDRISRNPAAYDKYERKQELLDTMIENRLLYVAALSSGISEDLEFLSQYRDFRNRALFEEWYNRDVTSKADPAEREIKARYRKDRETRYTTPEKVRASRIVTPTRELAESLRAVVLSDTAQAWTALAAAHSIAPDKDNAGDMGLFARGAHPKSIENVVFRMKPGEISRPVAVDSGYALFRLTERHPRKVRSYDEVRSQITVQLRQENTNRMYEECVADLKKRADIFFDSTALAEGRDTLAMVNGVLIDRGELDRRIEDIPPMFRGQFQTPDGMNRILEQLVLENLILRECEARDMWLWNRVVDQLLARKSRALIDLYRRRMTTEQVSIDSSELMEDYQANLAEFFVPAQVHAREVVAATADRAARLRRWAVAGRIPAMLSGRALLLPESGRTDPARDAFLTSENPDSVVGAHPLAGRDQRDPSIRTVRVGASDVLDLGQRTAAPAGPYHSPAQGLAFADISLEDELYRPVVHEIRTAEDLVQILKEAPPTDSAGTTSVDTSRFGVYIGLTEPLPKPILKTWFELPEESPPEPTAIEGADLLVRITQRDSAQDLTFADLARRFSSSNTRWNGGDLYWITKEDKSRDPQVIDAAFSLPAGRISRIIKLSDTAHAFIKVEEKKQAHHRPFAEVRGKIDGKLRRQKEDELLERLLAELRSNAKIDIVMTEADFIFESESEIPLEEEGKPVREEE